MNNHASSTCVASSASPENANISTLLAQLAPVTANTSNGKSHGGNALRNNAGLLQRIADTALGREDSEIRDMACATRGFLSVCAGRNADFWYKHATGAYLALRVLTEDALRSGGYAEMANSLHRRA